ncbi:MAG: E3 binding domain-containing protein, partial [Chloroflexota bacterium]|nr:E3 binding domain-containing protein [Chloroflexota bacterium]
MAKVTMPQLGESVAEGTIGKWLKQPGDHVAKYEPLVEVITDKVNAEVPSPFEGTLTEILAEEGATVPNNAEIAVIETAEGGDGESPASGATAPVVTSPAPESDSAPAATSGPAEAPAEGSTKAPASAPAPATAPADGPAGSDERPVAVPMAASAQAPAAAAGGPAARMTPAVRRLLREHGLTAAQIVGTGGGGRITREDVIDHVESVRTGQPVGAQGGT